MFLSEHCVTFDPSILDSSVSSLAFRTILLHYAPRLMVLSGTSLNYLIGLGSIILFLGVIIAAIPLTEETGNAVMCNVSNTEDLV